MTALNLIVQPGARSAYLLTDTAVFSFGTVIEFSSKVAAIDFGGGGAVAIGASGIAPISRFLPYFRHNRGLSLPAFLQQLPTIFRAVENELVADGKPQRLGRREITVALAAFDLARNSAIGYAISNDIGGFPPGCGPYRLHRLSKPLLTPFSSSPIEVGVDICDPRQWDIARQSEALVQAQRADPFPSRKGPYTGVGGQAILTRVSAAGIEQRLIKTWPDRTGRRIEPKPEGAWNWLDRAVAWRRAKSIPQLPIIRMGERPIRTGAS